MTPSKNWKTRLLQTHIEEFSYYAWKIRAQFFWTTTGMQSRPYAFEESRFVMIFWTILGVTEIWCSFRLVLEEKTAKEIPESSRFEFLEKFLANNFALSGAEDNTSEPLNKGGIADLPLVRIGNSPKVPRANFLGSNELFCFISICKFGSFKNPFATITSLSELYFTFRFILWVQ